MRRRCSPQAVHGSRPQGQNRTTSRHVPRCSGSQLDCGARILEEPARTKHTPRRADEHAPFEKEVECNIAPVCRPAALRFDCRISARAATRSRARTLRRRTYAYLRRNCHAKPIGWLADGFGSSSPICPATQSGLEGQSFLHGGCGGDLQQHGWSIIAARLPAAPKARSSVSILSR